MKKITVLLDAGHGGLDAFGKYHCIADGKLYKHTKRGFHGNGYFYEGHFNRLMLQAVEKALNAIGIDCITLSDPILDLRLQDRVLKANHYHKALNGNCFVLSLHANASPRHNARGFEVFTSPGETQSDTLATFIFNHVADYFGDRISMRFDTRDGDLDKEARFFILTRTKSPAVLVEHLFFDQLDDALLLMDSKVIESFAAATALACNAFIKHLGNAR